MSNPLNIENAPETGWESADVTRHATT